LKPPPPTNTLKPVTPVERSLLRSNELKRPDARFQIAQKIIQDRNSIIFDTLANKRFMKTYLQPLITPTLCIAALSLATEIFAQTPTPSAGTKMKAIVYHEF